MSEPIKRILFLDVDGVMNSVWSFQNIGESRPPRMTHADLSNGTPNFLPRAIAIVQRLVSVDKFTIVMSSTWRKLSPLEDFDVMLQVPIGTVIDRTPDSFDGFRGREINTWIRQAREKNLLAEDCKFIILDDDKDFTQEQYKENFVQTKWYDPNCPREAGLNWWHYNKIKHLLGEEEYAIEDLVLNDAELYAPFGSGKSDN